MKESNKFYQVFQKGRSVGFFKEKKVAQKYAEQFRTDIEGYDYPVKIKEMSFLDEQHEEQNMDSSEFSDMNWDAWRDDNDCTSEHGGV
tara:strand:+ start:1674 stop:1937 length:264 start_codon:yes stop_codon:yes gene_type:complete